MILPREKSKPTIQEPRRLFLFSHAKTGKTSALAQLPNSLIIDLEESAGFYESSYIDVKKESKESGKTLYEILKDIAISISEANKAANKRVYDFIIIDTTSVLENIARSLATTLYKKTIAGKNFTGNDVVSDLSQGAGYEQLRKAFDMLYGLFQSSANKCLILSGHVKISSINKEGKDLQARDIQLTGKLKQIVCSDADAIGYMYRNKETNENILSFKTSEQDLATGARLEYLSGEEFVISEKKEGVLITYWDKVFPSIKE